MHHQAYIIMSLLHINVQLAHRSEFIHIWSNDSLLHKKEVECTVRDHVNLN